MYALAKKNGHGKSGGVPLCQKFHYELIFT
jgi:hypothetical protein